MKLRDALLLLLFVSAISPARAGGFEGGGGDIAGPLLLAIGLFFFSFAPIAAIEGAYSFGNFSSWQLPLVAAGAIMVTGILRPWKGKWRLFALPLVYIAPIVVTNFWALSHRVDHSHDFPSARIIGQIDWRSPPTESELLAKTGKCVWRAKISSSDPKLPTEVADALARYHRAEAIVLVFSETAWDTTIWSYVLFDASSGVYFSYVGYHDWHKRPRPDRWPNLK